MSDRTNVTALHPGILPVRENQRKNSRPRTRRTQALDACDASLLSAWPFGSMSAEAVAKLIGVDTSTVRRWHRARKVPKPLHLLAHILMTGDLGPIDSAWAGWSLHRGGLHALGIRQPFTASELQHLPFTAQRVASLEATIRRLELELKHYREHRDQAPERRQLESAMHRATQLGKSLALITAEFERLAHECVSDAECSAAGGTDAAMMESQSAREATNGLHALEEARVAAHQTARLCAQRLAAMSVGDLESTTARDLA